jgi:hypothetical protein
MASPGLSEIVTTTLRNRTGKLADNMSKNIALLNRMNKRGTINTADGGRTIVQELEYAENSTFTRYSGYQVLNISPSDVFTAAEFDWKQAAVAVTASGLEADVQNTGTEAIIKLVASRVRNAEKTMQNNLWSDMYSDGTASNQIGGLQLLVADNASSGTVGGINRATYAFWRNQYYDATSDGGSAATTANIQKYMNTVYNRTVRGTDKPDLILADTNYYNLYLGSLQAIQRIASDEMAQAGFTSLKYMAADVVLDGFPLGSGSNLPNTGIAPAGGANAASAAGCPVNHMYFLNTEYIHWRPHVNRNMVPLETVNSINQDATVKLLVWAGNMTLSNGFLQSVLKD